MSKSHGKTADAQAPALATGGRAASPASVWLCAPRPDQDDPPSPTWPGKVLEAFSNPGDRVILRGVAGYPGLAGEMAALLATALDSGRRASALLPTPSIAARTRRLLSIVATRTGEPTNVPVASENSDSDEEHGQAYDDQRHTAPRAVVGTGTSTVLAVLATADTPTPRSLVTIDPAGQLAATAARLTTAADAANPKAARGRVGVGRRRAGMEAAPADLVVVLAGPVAAGARAPRRTPSARLLAAWARPLRPGGLLVVLTPPPLGRGAYRARQHAGSLVAHAQAAGLAYTQHIVLLHAPVTDDGRLCPPPVSPRPHAPFTPVHTDCVAFTHHPVHPDPPPHEEPVTTPILMPRRDLSRGPSNTPWRAA